MGQDDRDRLEAVLGEQPGQRLDGVHAGIDDDALLPRSGSDGVAVGAERAGGKGADEHPCRLRGTVRRAPVAARERSAAPPRLAPDRGPRRADVPGTRPADAPARSRSSTVPTNKQRRQAAQRHLQKQLERRADEARKRRRNLGIVATVVAVAVVVVAALLITGVFSGDDDTTDAASTTSAAAPTSSAAAATTNADGTIACTYSPDDVGQPEPHRRRHPAHARGDPDPGHRDPADEHQPGRPDAHPGPGEGPVRGGELRLPGLAEVLRRQPLPPRGQPADLRRPAVRRPDRHRLGRPELQVRPRRSPEETTYPRGTIAMANTGQPGSTGSQFFLCFVDTQLSPDYTAVGTVDEAGLAVLDTDRRGRQRRLVRGPGRRRRPEHPGHDQHDDRRRLSGPADGDSASSPRGPQAVTRSTSKTPSTLRTVCSTAPR